MIQQERDKVILNELKTQKVISTKNLSVRYKIPESTLRADLRRLAAKGMAKKVFGGALHPSYNEEKLSLLEEPISLRVESDKEEKQEIAEKAATLVKSGDTVFIDAGSTGRSIAENLCHLGNIQIVTNSVIALIAAANGNAKVIVTGGRFRRKNFSLINPFASYVIEEISPDIFFMGFSGLSLREGFSSVDFDNAQLSKEIIKRAKKTVSCGVSSKFGKRATARICALEDVDLLLTDSNISEEWRAQLKEAGIRLG